MSSEPGAMTDERLAEIEGEINRTELDYSDLELRAEELIAALRASQARERELREALKGFTMAGVTIAEDSETGDYWFCTQCGVEADPGAPWNDEIVHWDGCPHKARVAALSQTGKEPREILDAMIATARESNHES